MTDRDIDADPDAASPAPTDSAADFSQRFARVAAGYGQEPDPENPADVLAMPVILDIPKLDPPSAPEILACAASAAVLLCLVPQAGPGGEWHDPVDRWLSARIRKIARRARGSKWAAVQDVPGVTVVGPTGAGARACVPGPVGSVDKRIAKLQIGGTDLAAAESDSPEAADGVPTLWIRAALNMTVGKAAAQVGHASMLLATVSTEAAAYRWYLAGCPTVVRYADEREWSDLERRVAEGTAVAVRDAGYTEVDPGACTVIATA